MSAARPSSRTATTTGAAGALAASRSVAAASGVDDSDSSDGAPSARGVAGTAGVAGSVGHVVFFTALARGPIGVIAPIFACSSAGPAVIAVSMLGERPSVMQLAGILVAIAGVALVSRHAGEGDIKHGKYGAVPLALIGAVFALSISGTDLSVIVFLGCIVLAGIVVNNGIILIDQINQLRSEGMPFDQAVLEGSISRVRPVMMTMLSSLIGLLPQTGWLASLPFLGGSTDGIELRAPMAVTVIAGLLSSTLLTLIVVPLVYSLIVRRKQP